MILVRKHVIIISKIKRTWLHRASAEVPRSGVHRRQGRLSRVWAWSTWYRDRRDRCTGQGRARGAPRRGRIDCRRVGRSSRTRTDSCRRWCVMVWVRIGRMDRRRSRASTDRCRRRCVMVWVRLMRVKVMRRGSHWRDGHIDRNTENCESELHFFDRRLLAS